MGRPPCFQGLKAPGLQKELLDNESYYKNMLRYALCISKVSSIE
jgi:hypothetical protein